MQTPSSNRNLQNDFNSPESISPWSYTKLQNKPSPNEIPRPSRHPYRPAWGHMAGETMSSYTPSNQQFQVGPDTIITPMDSNFKQSLKDRLLFL